MKPEHPYYIPYANLCDALATPVLILVWGFAAGMLLWLSGVDTAIQYWLEDNYLTDFNVVMRVLGELGKGTAQIGLCVLFGVGWMVRGRMRGQMNWSGIQCVLLAVPVFLLAGIANWILKWGIGRGRPKMVLWNGYSPFDVHPFAMSAQWWSFPSGHSCSTFAIAVWLGLAFPQNRWMFWTLATVLSVSRFLALTPHYLGDVVAGAALGAAIAVAVWNVMQFYRGRA